VAGWATRVQIAEAIWLNSTRSCSTLGIGENAPAIRERVCLDAVWLGVELDAVAKAGGRPRISAPGWSGPARS